MRLFSSRRHISPSVSYWSHSLRIAWENGERRNWKHAHPYGKQALESEVFGNGHASFGGGPGEKGWQQHLACGLSYFITGVSKELLEQEAKPLVEDFLRERGLELSSEKTTITHIEQGFYFLSQTVRRYQERWQPGNERRWSPVAHAILTFMQDATQTQGITFKKGENPMVLSRMRGNRICMVWRRGFGNIPAGVMYQPPILHLFSLSLYQVFQRSVS